MKKILILVIAVIALAVSTKAQEIIPAYNEVKMKKSVKGEFTVRNNGVTPMPVTVEAREVSGKDGKPVFSPISTDIHVELPNNSAVVPPKGQYTFSYKVECPKSCAVAFFSGMMSGKVKDTGIQVKLWIPSVVWACTDSAKGCRVRTKTLLGIVD